MRRQKQHAFSARVGPLIVLKPVVDDDVIDVFFGVTRKLAQLRELPTQRGKYPRRIRFLSARLYPARPFPELRCDSAANENAEGKTAGRSRLRIRARESRGRMPSILMNGQAAAYSSFRRIRESVTLSRGQLDLEWCHEAWRKNQVVLATLQATHSTNNSYSLTSSESCFSKTAASAAGVRSFSA